MSDWLLRHKQHNCQNHIISYFFISTMSVVFIYLAYLLLARSYVTKALDKELNI